MISKNSKFQIDPMMNKRLSIITSLVLGMLCWAGLATAQVNHPHNTGSQQVTVVPAVGTITYFDAGGQFGNYPGGAFNANTTQRFAPTTAGAKIQATFTSFNLYPNSFDALYVFDGQNTAAPKIASPNAAPIVNNIWGAGGYWGTVAPNNVAPNVVRATPGNATGNLTFAFTSSQSFSGWSANVIEFIPCNPVPNPASYSISNSPGTCTASLNVPLPTFNPAGCGNIAPRSLRYRLDALTPVVLLQPYPASINLTGLTAGNHTLLWEVLSGAGSGEVLGSVIVPITVNDTEPPVLTCPADVIINLNPGLCCAIVSWADPTITDNCPFIGPVTSLLQTCTYTNYWSGYMLNLQNLTTDNMIINGVQIQAGLAGSPAGNYNLSVYMRNGTYVGNTNSNAGWTLCASQNINVTAGFPTNLYYDIPFTTQFTMLPSSLNGIYVVIGGGNNLGVRVVANVFNTAPTTNGELSIVQNPSTWTNGLFQGTSFNENPRPWLRVDYQVGGDGTVTQIDGPLSGEELCKDDSPWTVTYEGFDAQGNRGECSFTIEVNEYANPVSDLNCNDIVQVSLGEDCDTEVGADDILEGGPYGCYDDYEVMIFNAQNQPLPSSPFVGRQQIGGTFKVKVTDPETGNSCWGEIVVEEKLPPVIECADLNLACGEDIPLAPAPFFFEDFAPLAQNVGFTNYWSGWAVNLENISAQTLQITSLEVQASLAGSPAGNYSLKAFMRTGTHVGFTGSNAGWTLVGQITANITAGFPTVLKYDIPLTSAYAIPAGQIAGLYVVVNDGAGVGVRVVAALGNAPTADANLRINQTPGNWVNGLFGGVAFPGENPRPQLVVSYQVQADPILVTDNCSSDQYMNTIGQGLEYGDDIVNYTCAENAAIAQTIYRVWTATDEWGNSAQCIQQIDIRRATIGSLELPRNWDDLDTTSFDCSVPYPLPDVSGYPAGGGCGSLQLDYWDKVLNICQASYTILRTWTIHDMCTGDTGSHTQIIKVLDKTPPVMTPPNEHDIKIGATQKVGYQDCTANVMLPWIQNTDDCSTTNNITFYAWTTLPNGTIVIVNTINAQGQFVFNLPVGYTYTFIYTAIDNCGNKSELSIDVDVEDTVPPVVICETLHTVALTDSITYVFAESFDDGSYDDCSDVVFDARRGTMNASGAYVQHPCNLPGDFLYNPQVRFYCCDAQSDVEVVVDLRVRDAYGNVNNCMVPVTIVDKVRPVIWCPEDITVQCGMPYTPTEKDTFHVSKAPNMLIKNAYPFTYTFPIDIFGIPADAKITDLDLSLNIDHEVVNQLQITLYSPLNRKATVMTVNSCAGQPVQYPWGIDVTFNDQAYNINVFNSTGQKVAAPYTCTSAKPSVGAFNQGQMKPQGDELKTFNGQPLNSFANKFLCFTAGQNDINAATNRMSNFSIQQFILQAGLLPGDRILLEYSNATAAQLEGIEVGSIYLFQVINNNTIEFLTLTGSDITSVPSGSTHMFCASGTWLLVVEDTAPLGGGNVNEFSLHIEYVLPTGLKPHATDNTEECGLEVTYQDLATPDKCSDNTFINRRWRVDDAFGNNTSCIQRVYFTDNTPLTVQFPCDVTIQCQDLDDLEATGDVRHNGDCELVGIEHIDHTLVTTDACFKVLRTWLVKDWCRYQDDGNVDYPTTNINDATEEITFTTAINALITSRRIDVGDRVTLRYVTSGSVEIPGLIEGDIYSVVRVSGTTFRFDYNTTKQQTVNITGAGTGPHIFRFANSERGLPLTCDVLVEWYPFVEWYTACCNPVAERRAYEDDGDGYFKYTQEIKVVDNTAPQWVDCSDRDFCSFDPNCAPIFVDLLYPATDNCTPEDQLSYTYFIDAFNNGTVDITGVGNDASGVYPNGTHKIVFKVTDQCGNWNTCTSLFTIRDCKKPTPICINGLSVDLMPSTGMAQVWATSLEAGDSYDNCTEYEDLIILVERFSNVGPTQTEPDSDASDAITVTCDDLPPLSMSPVVEVVVWVGDEAGNWDYCVTTLWVQDNMGACGQGSAAVTTLTANEAGEPVDDVNVELTGPGVLQQMTDNSGTVTFAGLTVGQAVTVAPTKDVEPLNGVSTYDLLLIQKHLLGIKSLNSPYKLIAADVNNSANISISDIIELRKMILTPGLNFKDNTSWRFVESAYVFPNASKPYGFPETKSMNLVANNSANFVAVKTGDVSGDHTPNSLMGTETRNSVGTLMFAIADQTLAAGQEYTVAVTADNFRAVQGYQYTMDFDASVLEFVSVNAEWADLSESNFGRAKVAEGILTTSWNGSEGVTLTNGEVLYTVTFRAKANTKLSTALKVNSRVTRAEAYDANEEQLDVQFRFDGGLVVGGEFALYQNEPNPFRDVTIIGFNLPEATTATLKVYDVTGKVVKVVSGDYAKGYNTINLTRVDIQGNGMLYYQLDTPTDSATKRMILVD